MKLTTMWKKLYCIENFAKILKRFYYYFCWFIPIIISRGCLGCYHKPKETKAGKKQKIKKSRVNVNTEVSSTLNAGVYTFYTLNLAVVLKILKS